MYGILQRILTNPDHEKLRKSIALYQSWRMLLFATNKDGSGARILEVKEEADCQSFFVSCTEYIKIADVVRWTLDLGHSL